MESIKRSLLWMSFSIVLVLVLFLSGCRNAQETYVYGGKITGRAVLVGKVDLDYTGVTVNLKTSSTLISSVLTDATGKFTFSDLQDGLYTVECSKALYAQQTTTPNPTISKSSAVDVGDIDLAPLSPPPPPL